MNFRDITSPSTIIQFDVVRKFDNERLNITFIQEPYYVKDNIKALTGDHYYSSIVLFIKG